MRQYAKHVEVKLSVDVELLKVEIQKMPSTTISKDTLHNENRLKKNFWS